MRIKYYEPSLPEFSEVSSMIEDMFNTGNLYPSKYTEQWIGIAKEYFKVGHAIPVSCASDALICLLSILEDGSKVVIPAYTFRATYQALEWNNLQPVLVDVDDSGMMDVDQLKQCLLQDPDIKAVIPVHWWGNIVDQRVIDICIEHNVLCFFDGAQAFGSNYDGKALGRIGDATCVSLAATKPLACGEGGLILTNNSTIADFVERAALHGQEKGFLDSSQKGMNAKIQEFNCILAIAGIKHLDRGIDTRNKIAQVYEINLAHLPVKFQQIDDHVLTNRSYFGFWVENKDTRDALAEHLKTYEIETKNYCPSISEYAREKCKIFSCEKSERLANTVISIPCHARMDMEEVDYVVQAIRGFFK